MSENPRKTVLVTGGAGYIGSHACKALAANGFVPVTYDNLSTGWRDAVKFGPFEKGDLSDRKRLDAVFATYSPMAVMHFAALSDVGQSMREPALYWRNNASGSLTLIQAMLAAGCKRMVFSSTCATYGEQDGVMLDENSAQMPINAYGASKLAIEQMLGNFDASDNMKSVIFRYFNVAGADPEAEVGEHHRPESHLVPLMLDAIDGKRANLTVYGTDYATPDGTCIRDYVHVTDLIDAHVSGLKCASIRSVTRVFNLGTGKGFSVREVVDACQRVTGRPVPITDGPRRPGDCTQLISGSGRASAELGWNPARSTMNDMIADAWRWHQTGSFER